MNSPVDFAAVREYTVPEITTSAVSEVRQTTALGGGNVTADGGYPVTTRGVCWSITKNPTISNNKTIDGSGIGSFASSVTGLLPNTIYYVRAYAINSKGTAYGNEQSFKTNIEITLPAVKTITVTDITLTSAKTGR